MSKDRQAELIRRFTDALSAMPPEVGKRHELGQQFNAYEDADNDEEDDPDWWEYHLSIGPITSRRHIIKLVGEREAMLIEAALKLAAHVSASVKEDTTP